MVLMAYNVGMAGNMLDRSVIYKISSILFAMPVKVVGLHACVNDPKLEVLANLATLFVGSHNRVRYRCHVGKLKPIFSV
jgi:hypothetical protein